MFPNAYWATSYWTGVYWPPLAADKPTGGFLAYPRRPSKKEIEEERRRLGIIPEPEIKPEPKRVEKLEKPLKLESITTAKEIGEEVERLKAWMFEAEERKADVDTLLRIHLALSAADARAREIEEQDIVFVMAMLMV